MSQYDSAKDLSVNTEQPSLRTKACPMCGEEILRAARKCKHCGEYLVRQPAVQPSYRPQQQASNSKAAVWAIAICILGVCVVGGLIGLSKLREKSIETNEISAISRLRTLSTYEAVFFDQNKRYGTWEELAASGMTDSNQLSRGYKYEIKVNGSSYEAFATPESYNWTGKTSYYVCDDFVIRGRDKGGLRASRDDSPIGGTTNYGVY